MEKDRIIIGDAVQGLRTLPDKCVDMCVTSPPYYGLRDYGEDGQIGLENTPEEFIERLVEVFREVKRVMKDDGTLWLNIGDSYWGSGSRGFDFTDKFTEKSKVQQGSKGTIDLSNVPKLIGNYKDIKNKDLIGIPWMLAFALRADGWYLRQDIIWHKPNPMPESVTDRCTKSHEYFFLLSKSPRYYFDYKAISEQAAWFCDVIGENWSAGWISVEDRTPEDVRDYLVVTDEGNIHKAVFTGERWYNSDTTNYIRDGEVTHWMFPPEPPEVEE